VRGLNWGAISIVSDAPCQPSHRRSGKTDETSSPAEGDVQNVENYPETDPPGAHRVPKPQLSALQRFSSRTPQEKEKFFLLFSQLLKELAEK